MALVSVVTPASRDVNVLSFLFRDFKNQTFKDFEHIVVYDGKVPEEVQVLADQYKKIYNLRFYSIEKDLGDMHRSPGTKSRNYGTSLAKGKYVLYCDDDNRFKDTYIEVHVRNMQENTLTVTQIACAESRIFRNGKKDRFVLIPEIGIPIFPVICHVDTASCMFPIKWVLEDPWRYEPEHDFRLIKRIVEKHKPSIVMINGIYADLDGLATKGIKDWISIPPFFRG